MLVASVIPAEPSPCANNAVTQNEKNRVNMVFNELIFAIIICCLCFPIEIQESGFANFLWNLSWECGKATEMKPGFTRNLFPSYFSEFGYDSDRPFPACNQM